MKFLARLTYQKSGTKFKRIEGRVSVLTHDEGTRLPVVFDSLHKIYVKIELRIVLNKFCYIFLLSSTQTILQSNPDIWMPDNQKISIAGWKQLLYKVRYPNPVIEYL
jgi:hypothetical protein